MSTSASLEPLHHDKLQVRNDIRDPDYSYPMGSLSANSTEIDVIVKLEAVGGSLSLIGVLLIFITFAWSKRLRTLPNTFIAFASIANVGASVACLIGRHGVTAGSDSALCITQAFLLEMFMQSDPWWSFAMAFNVFLVFFFQANPDSFRKWLWLYCLICFGGPAIPAIACAVMEWPVEGQTGAYVPIYGDATLWCWIGAEAAVLRIYTYYMPIWICIAGSILIYFAVGWHVFRQRNQLKNLTLSNPEKTESTSTDIQDGFEKSVKESDSNPDFYGTKVTEIQITTTNSPPNADYLTLPSPTITGGQSNQCHPKHQNHHQSTSSNPETLGRPSAGPFQSISSVSVENSPAAPREGIIDNLRTIWRRCVRRLTKMDPVKMSYLRTSFVFGISVLVTWTPSSILRVHDLVSPHNFSFPLNVAAAIVLPLQGAWNAIIYFSTSWTVVREEWMALIMRIRGDNPDDVRMMRAGVLDHQRGRTGIEKSNIRIQRTDTNNSEVELTSVSRHHNGGGSNVRAMRGSF